MKLVVVKNNFQVLLVPNYGVFQITVICIILNITASLIILNISSLEPKNGHEKIANIPWRIFDDVYPKS